MKSASVISFLLFLLFSISAQAQSSTFTGIGKWGDAGHWSSGVPTNTVSAVLSSGSSATVQNAQECFSLEHIASALTIEGTGSLVVHGKYVNDSGTLNIDDGGSLTIKSQINNSFGFQKIEVSSSIVITSSLEVDETFNFSPQ